MTITGTQDNPKVKLGKQTEDLQETEYVEPQKTPAVRTQIPVQEGVK